MLINYVYYYPSSFAPINLILAVYCPFKSNPHFYNIISTFDPNQANVSSTDFIHYNIYPNPTNDIITIKTDHKIDSYTIYDVTGKKIMQTAENTIDLRVLTNGVYILTFELEGKTQTKKIILN